MSKMFMYSQNKDYALGNQKINKLFIAVCSKATVFDELWMILDYCFIGALFYLNSTYIKSGLFAFSLFIWLMLMLFCYPRERKIPVNNKEEFLEQFEKMWKDYENENK